MSEKQETVAYIDETYVRIVATTRDEAVTERWLSWPWAVKAKVEKTCLRAIPIKQADISELEVAAYFVLNGAVYLEKTKEETISFIKETRSQKQEIFRPGETEYDGDIRVWKGHRKNESDAEKPTQNPTALRQTS